MDSSARCSLSSGRLENSLKAGSKPPRRESLDPGSGRDTQQGRGLSQRRPGRKSLMKTWLSPLTPVYLEAKFTFMENPDFDQLLKSYKEAVDHWVDAIHTEESLATEDHSMVEMELWDDAGFKVQDAELVAKNARDAYKDALRNKNYGI
jgi:hypothetical protein